MHTSNSDIRRGNVDPLKPGKEQASNRSNMERNMSSIAYRYRKTNIWVREKAKTLLNKSSDGSGHGQLDCDVVQGVSRCGYEVLDNNQ